MEMNKQKMLEKTLKDFFVADENELVEIMVISDYFDELLISKKVHSHLVDETKKEIEKRLKKHMSEILRVEEKSNKILIYVD
jgi:uncharacterized protein YqeY